MKKHNSNPKKKSTNRANETISELSSRKEKKQKLLIIIEHRIQKTEKEIEKKKNNGTNTKRQEKELRTDKDAAHSIRYTIAIIEKKIEKIKATNKKKNAQQNINKQASKKATV